MSDTDKASTSGTTTEASTSGTTTEASTSGTTRNNGAAPSSTQHADRLPNPAPALPRALSTVPRLMMMPTDDDANTDGIEKVGMNTDHEIAKKFFNRLDTDQNGFLDSNELKFALRLLSPDYRLLTDTEVMILLRAGDEDGDGRISFAEFKAMCN